MAACGGEAGPGAGTQATVPCSPKARQVPSTVLLLRVNEQEAPGDFCAQAAIGGGGGGGTGRHTSAPSRSLQVPAMVRSSSVAGQAALGADFTQAPSRARRGGAVATVWVARAAVA